MNSSETAVPVVPRAMNTFWSAGVKTNARVQTCYVLNNTNPSGSGTGFAKTDNPRLYGLGFRVLGLGFRV